MPADDAIGDARTFFDALAPAYHLLYQDWAASVARQGAALAGLLCEHDVRPGDAVHDAACGIGTQAIGLAQHGFAVSASDLAPVAVARARAELACRGLSVAARVADVRDLDGVLSAPVSAVLACDEVLPHLPDDAEILRAFRAMRAVLRPGGVAVVSMRDHQAQHLAHARRGPEVHPYGLRHDGDRRLVAVQVWEWTDADHYDLRLYLTSERPDGGCDARVLRTRLYAASVCRLRALLREAGFASVERRDGILFQPVLVATAR
ncbi:class I SAM-dependent methyltransferase [Roseisolibacter agri]|uniref:Methyltransferase domain-containing protein n=1 Tax=Roseisolibacter agri TaxID=2014610 RepID=A0AA37Q1J7_9BACT|nr:class I SAM-dependent methyltransferase [Roseisolibacter agri]GLC24844.1 hypothetical protein rosag_13570 [Roseisolibacter agri]